MKHYLSAAITCTALLFTSVLPTAWGQDTPAASAPADPELKSLQGTWEGVEKGRETQGKATLTITDNTISFTGANPQEWYKGTIILRGDTNPKQLDGTITECPQPDFVGKTSRGIYKLEGDTLTMVGRQPGNPDRPASLDDADRARTFVFKRAAK